MATDGMLKFFLVFSIPQWKPENTQKREQKNESIKVKFIYRSLASFIRSFVRNEIVVCVCVCLWNVDFVSTLNGNSIIRQMLYWLNSEARFSD